MMQNDSFRNNNFCVVNQPNVGQSKSAMPYSELYCKPILLILYTVNYGVAIGVNYILLEGQLVLCYRFLSKTIQT